MLRSRLDGLTRVTVLGSGFIAAGTASGLSGRGIDVRIVVRRGMFAKFGAGDPAVHWLGEFAFARGSTNRAGPVGLAQGKTRFFAVGDVSWRWNNRHSQYVRPGHWASAIVDAKVTAAFLATEETHQKARSGLQGRKPVLSRRHAVRRSFVRPARLELLREYAVVRRRRLMVAPIGTGGAASGVGVSR